MRLRQMKGAKPIRQSTSKHSHKRTSEPSDTRIRNFVNELFNQIEKASYKYSIASRKIVNGCGLDQGWGLGVPTAQYIRKQVGPDQTYQVRAHLLLGQPHKPPVTN